MLPNQVRSKSIVEVAIKSCRKIKFDPNSKKVGDTSEGLGTKHGTAPVQVEKEAVEVAADPK